MSPDVQTTIIGNKSEKAGLIMMVDRMDWSRFVMGTGEEGQGKRGGERGEMEGGKKGTEGEEVVVWWIN